jgi:hypothetical protein
MSEKVDIKEAAAILEETLFCQIRDELLDFPSHFVATGWGSAMLDLMRASIKRENLESILRDAALRSGPASVELPVRLTFYSPGTGQPPGHSDVRTQVDHKVGGDDD